MPDTSPPLSVSAIAAALGPLACRFDVDVLDACASTNTELMHRAEAGAPSGTVVVAERQTAGRGRLGRTWFSGAGAGLTFSLLWRFAPGTAPAGLSLAVGLALTEALVAMGLTGLTLKWPNDLLRDGRKLAGILVELVPGATHAAVIGIGLNLRLPADLPEEVRACAAALDSADARDTLLARLLTTLHGALNEFGRGGFAALRQRWNANNAHAGQRIVILSEFKPPLAGRCIGVDADGALLLETAAGEQRIISGEVSVRPA